MKTIITQVGSYTTGDAIADAVIRYWLALVEERRADVVDIPVIGMDGERSRVRLALGAMLPLAVVDAHLVEEFDDLETADTLLALARSVRPRMGPPFSPGELPAPSGGYDGSFI